MSTKVVLKLELRDDKDKQKALKAVSGLPGLESLTIKDKNLTVIGNVDPVQVVAKLRKFWHTELVTVGPSKEPEKEKKKDEKDSGKKEVDEKKMAELWNQYMNLYNKNYNTHPYYIAPRNVYYSAEENPNSCVIS